MNNGSTSGGSNPVDTTQKPGGTNTNTTDSARDSVYVAGFDNGEIVCWQNGREYVLATAAPGYYGNASGIAVVGTDIYVAGFVGDTAVYWKNGMENYLSDPDSSTSAATAIATSGTDIYIAGYGPTTSGGYYGGNGAVYWKNGVKTIVATNPNVFNAVSIAVEGTDVFVAATIGNDTAVYWKNGVRTTLGSHYSYAYGIAVSGSDVYVTGVDNGVPVYWKNGIRTALPYTALSACYGVVISGTDVYMVATYWINGERDTLTVSPTLSNASSIATNGKDVFVAGSISGFLMDSPVYWKNGRKIDLTEQTLTGLAEAITLDANNNVYVAGDAELLADVPTNTNFLSMICWKNGAIFNSNWMASGSSNLEITGIAVVGSDVYVAGSFGNFPTYWKNDSAVQFTDYEGQLYGMALAP